MSNDDKQNLEEILTAVSDVRAIKNLTGELYSAYSGSKLEDAERWALEFFLPENLRRFVPYIEMHADLFRDFSLEDIMWLKREGNPRAKDYMSSAPPDAINAIHSHYREVQLAVYKLFLSRDSPDVVLVHACNAGNNELALWAGAMLSLEGSNYTDEAGAIIYVAKLNVAAATAGNMEFNRLNIREQEFVGRLLSLRKSYAENHS